MTKEVTLIKGQTFAWHLKHRLEGGFLFKRPEH